MIEEDLIFKEKIEKYIERNLTRKRLEEFMNIESLFEREAIYNVRTYWLTNVNLIVLKNIDIKDLNAKGMPISYKDLKIQGELVTKDYVKIVNCEEDLFELIKYTKNEFNYRNQPYPVMFFNKNILFEDKICIFGIGCIDKEKENGEKFNSIIIYGKDFKDNCELRIKFSINNKGIDYKLFNVIKNEENIIKELAKYIINVLDFINHPEVIIKKKDAWFNNEKRMKRYQFPISSSIYLTLTNKMKRNVNDYLDSMKNNDCNYSFWVRGHYMHFRNKKRFHKLYSLDIDTLYEMGYQLDTKDNISKWKAPYIKNKDKPLINKRIRLVNKIKEVKE